MRIFLLLIILSLSTILQAADDEKYKACEKKAYEFYPEPNYSPRYGTAGQRGPGGFDNNYQDAIPTLSDNEMAKQKRKQFIDNCLKENSK